MKYVVVVPYAYQPYFDDFIKTVKIPRENMLLIDNTNLETNLGIMKSHNMGIDFMHQKDADWLIIMSAAIRFGEAGGLDFVKILEDHPGYHVIHGASENVVGGKQQTSEGGGHNKVFGWHLAAFSRECLDKIGRWDENFTPYGFDDIDISLRIRKMFKEKTLWDTFPCDVTDTTMSHSLQKAGVQSPSGPLIAYFVEKWGRHPGAWQWDGWEYPFNNEEYDVRFWPPAPNGGHWNE